MNERGLLPSTYTQPDRSSELTRYELRVRTALSQALVHSFPVHCTADVVHRRTTYRFRVRGERDLAEVVQELADHGVEVLEIRSVALPAA